MQVNAVLQSLIEQGLIPMMQSNRDERMLVHYAQHPVRVFPNKKEFSPVFDEIAATIEKTPLMSTAGPLAINDVSFFRYVNSGNVAGTYSDRAVQGQRLIQQFQSFANEIKSNQPFITLDIETMGNAADRLWVTEFAAQSFQVKNGTIKPQVKKSLSMLIAPDQQMQSRLADQIAHFVSNPSYFATADPATKRTLIDLMRYSTIGGDSITKATFGKQVVHSNIIDQVLQGKTIQEQQVIQRSSEFAAHMQSGLQNLIEKGHRDPLHAIRKINTFFTEHKGSHFITMNGDAFDLPTLQKWSSQLGIVMQMPTKHLDYQKVLEVAFHQPLEMHRMFGRPSSLAFQEGTMTLQELIRTFQIDQTQSHAALSDVFATAGVVSKSFPTVQSVIEQAESNQKPQVSGKPAGFGYSSAPLHIGDVLFSKKALINYDQQALDFQTTIQKGRFVIDQEGHQKHVLHAETFYEIKGIRNVSTGDEQRFALELFDPIQEKSTHIVRSGADAHYQLMDFLHRNFVNTDQLSKTTRKKMERHHLEDKARRQYERLFTIEEGKTQGLQAARRLYGNARVLKDRLAGQYGEIIARVEQEMEVIKQNAKLTDENLSKIRYEKIGKQLANRISHEEMMQLMDFRSLYRPEDQTYVFNKGEQRRFFTMAGRLMSEEAIFREAIEQIDQSALTDPEKRMAWNLFSNQVIQRNPNHKSVRKSLPQERRGFSFYDRMSGKQKKIDLHSFDEASGSLFNYVYEGAKNESLSNADRKQLVTERMRTLFASLYESGAIKRSVMDQFLHEHESLQLGIHDTIKRLTSHLMNDPKLIIRTIEETSMNAQQLVMSQQETINAAKEAIETTKQLKGEHISRIGGATIQLSPMMSRILSDLDQPHEMLGKTYLNPKHTASVQQLLEHIQKRFSTLHLKQAQMALQVNEAGTELILSVFNQEHSMSVLNQLAKGSSERPTQALQMVLPLISKKGTLSFGNRTINANQAFVKVGESIESVSSVQRMVMDLIQNGGIDRMLWQFKEGNAQTATEIGKQLMNELFDDFSGVRRNVQIGDRELAVHGMNDTLLYQQNLSDFLKQQQSNVESAMIHDLYQNASAGRFQLTAEDVLDSAWEEKRGKRTGAIRPFVSFEDLKPEARERILYHMPDWLKAADGTDQFFLSSVKSTHAGAMLGAFDLRQFYPYGHFSAMNKDNPVQALNRTSIRPAQMAQLEMLDGVYTKPMILTPMQEQLQAKGYDLSQIQVRTAIMNQSQIDERLEVMRKTDAGKELLKRAGMLQEDGSWVSSRYLNVYEQQGVFHDQLLKAFQYDAIKTYDVGSSFEWNPSLFDSKTNEWRSTAIQPGDLIGHQMVSGKREPLFYEEKTAGSIVSKSNDPNIAIRRSIDPFKFMVGLEKVTLNASGQMGYSQELMEAITGIKGVQVIMNTDFQKNKFFGSLLEANANRLYEHIISQDVTKRKALIDQVNQAGIDIQVEGQANQFVFKQIDTGQSATQLIDRMDALMKQFGLAETATIVDATYGLAGQQTAQGIFSMSANAVEHYGKSVNAQGKVILDYDAQGNPIYGASEKGVQIGPRELNVLRRKGLHQTHAYLLGQIYEQGVVSGRLKESIGMIEAIGFLAKRSDGMTGKQSISLSQLQPLPLVDENIATLRGTILDDRHVRALTGNAEANGFFMDLPSLQTEQGTLQIHAGDQPLNRIYIPFTKLQGKGAEVWKTELQRTISAIYRRAQDVTENQSAESFQKLQDSVDQYIKQLIVDTTTSKGQTGSALLKARLGNSVSGLAKVAPPSYANALGSHFTALSIHDAKAIGVYDSILGITSDMKAQMNENELIAYEQSQLANMTKQKEVFGFNLRYPTFTDKAVQVSRLYIDPSIEKGSIVTSSVMADLLKEDSDGDYHNVIAIDDEAAQQELKSHLKSEEKQRIARHESAWNRVIASHQEALDLDMQEAMEKDRNRVGTLSELKDQVQRSEINTVNERASKTGKSLVGMASDLNYTMRQLAESYGTNAEQIRAIEMLGEGLEQKLTISSKHGVTKGAFVEAKSGAFDFLNAIKNRQWDLAKEIDATYLGGEFAQNWQLNEASSSIDQIFSQFKGRMQLDTFRNIGFDLPELKLGTSSGIPYTGSNLNQIYDALVGSGSANGFQHELSYFLQQHTGSSTPVDSSVPVSSTVQHESPIKASPRVSGAAEMASDLTGGLLSSEGIHRFFKSNAKPIAIGGMALAGILAYQTINQPDQVTPQSMNIPAPPAYPIGEDPAIYGDLIGANVQIQASGSGRNQQDLSGLMTTAMSQSNFQGKSNISIQMRDNASQLNRNWYRDKIQEYV